MRRRGGPHPGRASPPAPRAHTPSPSIVTGLRKAEELSHSTALLDHGARMLTTLRLDREEGVIAAAVLGLGAEKLLSGVE